MLIEFDTVRSCSKESFDVDKQENAFNDTFLQSLIQLTFDIVRGKII